MFSLILLPWWQKKRLLRNIGNSIYRVLLQKPSFHVQLNAGLPWLLLQLTTWCFSIRTWRRSQDHKNAERLTEMSHSGQRVRVSVLFGLSAIGCVRPLVESWAEAAAAANLQMLIWPPEPVDKVESCHRDSRVRIHLKMSLKYIYLNMFRPDRMAVFWGLEVAMNV